MKVCTCPVNNVSGDRKAGVPAMAPLFIEASSPINSLQTPKSAILTRPHSPNSKLPACHDLLNKLTKSTTKKKFKKKITRLDVAVNNALVMY